MSAWDIAGAVAWPLSTALFLIAGLHGRFMPEEGPSRGFCLIMAIASLLGAVFSIARLCGAHL